MNRMGVQSGGNRTFRFGVAPWLLVGLFAGAIAGCGDANGPVRVSAVQVVDEHWPNGTLYVRRTVATDDDGNQVNHGPLTVWYESGELRSQGHWRDGRKHGQFVFWHKNGQKSKEFTWTDGLGDGVYTEWDEAGNRLRREVWCDGERVGDELTGPAS